MIKIKDNSLCCGCTACVAACPVQCITMKRDIEGFDYPFANPDLCIGCGKCESVCPILSPDALPMGTGMLKTWAARSDADEAGSSSGGIFPVLARDAIEKGGTVFGAAFLDVRTVGHVEDDIQAMQGSKYVQSDLFSSFEDVRSCLEQGRQVLFSGTPCQVAGLKGYLEKDYPGLVTVDCACHGVPGPGLWSGYVDALEERHGGHIVKVEFRDKTTGWRNYSFTVTMDDGRRIASGKDNDPYMALFLQDITLRPSCYNCRFRCARSGSDITLGDFWNAGKAMPKFNDGKGLNVISANSRKGMDIVASLNLRLEEVPVNEAIAENGGFGGDIPVPASRAAFFAGLPNAGKNLYSYMKSFVRRTPLHKRIYRSFHSTMSELKKQLLK